MSSESDDRPTTALVNVGQAVSRDLRAIGVDRVSDLRGADADEVFERLEAAAGHRLDPCMLDTVRSAVDQADGKPARHWSEYSRDRLAGRR